MTTLLPPVDATRQLANGVDPNTSAHSIRRALSPRTVAVIGASRTPGTIGYELLHNLITYGFTGAVYPVNPRAQSICCVKAYPSIADVPDDEASPIGPAESIDAPTAVPAPSRVVVDDEST